MLAASSGTSRSAAIGMRAILTPLWMVLTALALEAAAAHLSVRGGLCGATIGVGWTPKRATGSPLPGSDRLGAGGGSPAGRLACRVAPGRRRRAAFVVVTAPLIAYAVTKPIYFARAPRSPARSRRRAAAPPC